MKPDLHDLYVAAGLRSGRARTCGDKTFYGSEESADKVISAMDKKLGTEPRKVLVAYPCAFCENWHIGRKMSEAELLAVAHAPMSADEAACIPTSLLLRDVVAHGCDRLDRESLCASCRGKYDEIDRRFPPRPVKG